MTQLQHLAIGALAPAALRGADRPGECRHLDLGPEHPSRTGLLLIDVETHDDVITAARVQPGFNHRSAEKLFEVRDYRQLLMLADRHDWQSPFTGELGVALVCEQLMGLVPPVRATWLRTLLAEHARIGSHLAHLGFLPHRADDQALAARLRTARIAGRELMLAISGNRVHPMLNRLGGLALDVDAEWLWQFRRWADDCAALARQLTALLDSQRIGQALGVLDARVIDAYSLSGPVAAASGIERDLRLLDPYLAYPELKDELSAGMADEFTPRGDAASRFRVLAAEIGSSAAVISRCVAELADIAGPVETKLSKIVKLPDGEAYLAIDAPWGMAGFLLVSRAERTPWRLKLRTPSMANVQALQEALIGCPMAEVEVVIASLGWTNGDLDK
ncbi:NADH-quinone oxidoreductase subunit D [Luteococcus sp. H138]|uniref:NADH-quinone oxidoreductase subunit D-related protein n=1 Tax=unclassified Luteococcus TaxID=2639923 RepID=UPI00313BBF1C